MGPNRVPGNEGEVRAIIKAELEGYVDDLFTDRMGNLIVTKNEGKPGKHIGLSAHMDEVGMLVKRVDESGLLNIGLFGLDTRLLPSKIVAVGCRQYILTTDKRTSGLDRPDWCSRGVWH